MIAHSPKTWASFGRKCLIIGFRPCQTHAIPPTNGSVWKNWASWVREGQKIARRQKAPYALLSFFFSFSPPSDKRENGRERETQRSREMARTSECVCERRGNEVAISAAKGEMLFTVSLIHQTGDLAARHTAIVYLFAHWLHLFCFVNGTKLFARKHRNQ